MLDRQRLAADHFARAGIEASGAEGGEVAVHTSFFDGGGRRGVAVEFVNRGGGLVPEHFDVMDQQAAIEVVALRVQGDLLGHLSFTGLFFALQQFRFAVVRGPLFDGGCEPNLVFPDDRRRPTATGDGGLPSDILRFAPVDG